jgi:hypothetical protein
LEGRLDRYLKAVHAQMPSPNPAYDPNRPSTPEKGRGRGKKGGRENRTPDGNGTT